MIKEPILKLALSVYNNQGVYALLLGSGISRSAGIPTGWEITLDLVRKLAALQGEKPEPDPDSWYRKKYGKAPEYSILLDELTNTPSDRQALLRSYFEPSEEEREQGLKVPTPAHRAIAKLIQLGYIRMILTTNFDRLLEHALQEIGIEPYIISTEDDLKGAMPYVHTRCYIIKLHGDYLDTRIKNTPEELADYSEELNALLDRILDEFGLMVCGWSGEWDTALRNAILRTPNRRFTTYWLARGTPTEEADKVIGHRRAEVIPIESSDQFFTDLLEKLKALEELEQPHPISTAIAVATVKRYVPEPHHRIRLHDLIHEETELVYERLSSGKFETTLPSISKEEFQKRMHLYEGVVERLMAMLTALSYHDDGANMHILTRCLERVATQPRHSGLVAMISLQRYPAMLLIYSAGISALVDERFQNLAALLLRPRFHDETRREDRPLVTVVHPWSVFSNNTYKWIPYKDAERRYTPVSDYLFQLLKPVLHDYLPNERQYEDVFDLFEYLLALTYVDAEGISWSPIGRFGWLYKSRWDESPMYKFINVIKKTSRHPFLAAGFFGGSLTRLVEIADAHQEWLKEAVRGWW